LSVQRRGAAGNGEAVRSPRATARISSRSSAIGCPGQLALRGSALSGAFAIHVCQPGPSTR
jgi:hypothetical protein